MASPKSTTSIDYFQRDPFKTIKHKVAALSTDLNPCTIEQVRRLSGGRFHRNIKARACWPEDGSSTPSEMDIVFCVPRYKTIGEILDDAAISHFIRQQ